MCVCGGGGQTSVGGSVCMCMCGVWSVRPLWGVVCVCVYVWSVECQTSVGGSVCVGGGINHEYRDATLHELELLLIQFVQCMYSVQ